MNEEDENKDEYCSRCDDFHHPLFDCQKIRKEQLEDYKRAMNNAIKFMNEKLKEKRF